MTDLQMEYLDALVAKHEAGADATAEHDRDILLARSALLYDEDIESVLYVRRQFFKL